MRYVLDASAAVAFEMHEKGMDVVRDILYLRGSCYLHPVNWIEVHYKLCELRDVDRAEAALVFFRDAGVIVPEIPGDDFRRRVSEIKRSYTPLSLADCHVIALAELLGGTVVTSDRHMSGASDIVEIMQIR